MRFNRAVSLFGLLCSLPVSAAELPARRPGLWEVRTTIDNNAVQGVIKQCIDAATDQMLQSNAGPFAASACPERDVKQSENSMTIDSVCTAGGKPATAHSIVTGSFDSQYTMTVTSQSEELPGGKMTMTIEAKWLGPCAADQKPGDVVMSNGAKVNLPEIQKRSLLPGGPLLQK
jgi:Protein of unknown function (DUF3617)